MSYTVHLAAVSAGEIERARAAPAASGAASLIASPAVELPHDLVNPEVQPLASVVAELIDVGQPLRNDGWHPQRAPIVVDPETAMARARRIEDALAEAEPELGGLLADAVGPDLEAVRSLYAHASANHEWVLSYLSAPADPAVAARSLVPTVGTSVTPS
jgi:hypothetical protein